MRYTTKPECAVDLISRRKFLKFGMVTVAAVVAPLPVSATVDRDLPKTRELNFYNLHTHERLSVCYCLEGKYDPESLRKINHILRDHRNGEIKSIDTRLLDLLHTLSDHLESESPFHIISGYPSPATNTKLRRRSRGVASKSLHLLGKAVDIRLPGVKTRALRDAAAKIRGGGVGFYPKSKFVHVDVGRVRYW